MCEQAWAAGFYDGEGSTSTGVRKPRPGRGAAVCELSMQVHQMDPRPLHRFRAAVGVGTVYPVVRRAAHGGTYTIWRWQATAARAERALLVLVPWLSEPKQEQAALACQRVLQHREARLAAWRGKAAA